MILLQADTRATKQNPPVQYSDHQPSAGQTPVIVCLVTGQVNWTVQNVMKLTGNILYIVEMFSTGLFVFIIYLFSVSYNGIPVC